MPYNKKKQKCKQSDGTSGTYVLSYTDKKGKKHSSCHTSQKGIRGQIASIEEDDAKAAECTLPKEGPVVKSIVQEKILDDNLERILESVLGSNFVINKNKRNNHKRKLVRLREVLREHELSDLLCHLS